MTTMTQSDKAGRSSQRAERKRGVAGAGGGAPARGKKLKITLVRSTIGFKSNQADVVRGMKLRRLHHTVELPDTPATRGMIHKVRHLVEVSD
jgi:large subunit ribosomal protein L30